MIERTTIEGLVKYAKELIGNLKSRQKVTAKNTKIYRIDGGTKSLTIPAYGTNSFGIRFLPDSGKSSHAELLLDIDNSYIDNTFELFDIQLTPTQPANGTDWLVRCDNGRSSAITKNIGVAVNALENGTIILR